MMLTRGATTDDIGNNDQIQQFDDIDIDWTSPTPFVAFQVTNSENDRNILYFVLSPVLISDHQTLQSLPFTNKRFPKTISIFPGVVFGAVADESHMVLGD
jgi:hypothetical protein